MWNEKLFNGNRNHFIRVSHRLASAELKSLSVFLVANIFSLCFRSLTLSLFVFSLVGKDLTCRKIWKVALDTLCSCACGWSHVNVSFSKKGVNFKVFDRFQGFQVNFWRLRAWNLRGLKKHHGSCQGRREDERATGQYFGAGPIGILSSTLTVWHMQATMLKGTNWTQTIAEAKHWMKNKEQIIYWLNVSL